MAAAADSSRIFVRNLPATLTEDDFRSHFSKHKDITDVRYFPQRRIGYVGFKTPQDASTAVKFYNKTFIRMSRIDVELATPIVRNQPEKQPQSSIEVETNTNNILSSAENNPLKRKRQLPTTNQDGAKLKQFLGVMQATAKNQTWQNEAATVAEEVVVAKAETEDSSDDDIQTLKRKGRAGDPADSTLDDWKSKEAAETNAGDTFSASNQRSQSDKDWLRSKGGDMLNDNELMKDSSDPAIDHEVLQETTANPVGHAVEAPKQGSPTREDDIINSDPHHDDVISKITRHKRLYLRNLPFTITEEQLSETFCAYGALEEVHLPLDPATRKPKGYAFLLFADGKSAANAYAALDGEFYQGRLLHILPAQAKRGNNLDDYAISQLPLKQQVKIKRKMESSSATNKWNPLYMNMNDVMSSISDRMGIDKSELLDATSSDAAVKQTLAETHIIQEAKAYFGDQGVDLESFKPGQPRGDTAILVKNFPYGTSEAEIRDLFTPFGQVRKLLIPPGGTMALVEYAVAQQGKSAFASLKYRRIKDSILFLEKAPKNVFDGTKSEMADIVMITPTSKTAKPSATDLLHQDHEVAGSPETSTLFVRNLNFTTTTELLRQTFAPLTGFATAKVKTRLNSKRPGELLSMGFGFVEFTSRESAQVAIANMNGYNLEGHILDVRLSQRVLDHGEEQRRQDKAKAAASQQTKIIVKNLPFETSKKDVRELLATYGQLRSVRVPKKFDRSARGFAFAEFTTAREAANAMQALKSTHLLGRRLHLEYAAQDSVDPEEEIERMQRKVGAQVDKVTVQKLTGAGRRKFNIASAQEEEV